MLSQFSGTSMSFQRYLNSTISPHLIVVSDGAASDTQSSFGWCIGSFEPTTLFYQGHGHGSGHDPSSFRAEAFGALAAFRFLLHFLSYHNLSGIRNATLSYFCDNQSLIKSLRRLISFH